MSGIVAIVSRDQQTVSRGPAMLERLRHLDHYETRSIDAEGSWIGVCGRPLSTGSARETDAAGGVAAVVCGEFSNAARLRRELRVSGDAGSAALVIAAYRRWGAGLFRHLDGVFAVVVHDAREGLTCAGVDAYGGAVLQAVELGGDVLIASEAKAFLCDPRFTPQLDEEALSTLLALETLIDGRTLFAGVDGLGIGRHFEVSDGRLTTERHWDAREATGGTVRGEAYVEHLAGALDELAGWAFRGDRLLLPLTGGLDSRLLAAAAPEGTDLVALTFGSDSDPDVQRAAQVAQALEVPHMVLGLEEDYFPRYGDGTVWLTEGRLNPVANFVGGQMEHVADHDALVSGLFGEAGRSTMRGRAMIPDWALLKAGDVEFEHRLLRDIVNPTLAAKWWSLLFGARGDELRRSALAAAEETLQETRGLPVPDRIDIAMGELRFHAGRAGMLYADLWVQMRPPFLSRRWMSAVLAGAPEERIDDGARLRLIRHLDRSVARVPWVCTRLPLRESELALHALRRASRLRRSAPVDLTAAESGSAPAAATSRRARALSWAKDAIYRRGERREDWLRGPGRTYAESVLLSDRVAAHGVVDPRGLGALLHAQMSGEGNALAIGQLVNAEMWQRIFVDGDEVGGRAPVMVARESDAPDLVGV